MALLSTFSISLSLAMINWEGQRINLVGQLSTMLVPTLLVWGAKDYVIPVKHGYAASKVIPNCEIKIFHDAGHSVYKQKAKEFCQTLAVFFG